MGEREGPKYKSSRQRWAANIDTIWDQYGAAVYLEGERRVQDGWRRLLCHQSRGGARGKYGGEVLAFIGPGKQQKKVANSSPPPNPPHTQLTGPFGFGGPFAAPLIATESSASGYARARCGCERQDKHRGPGMSILLHSFGWVETFPDIGKNFFIHGHRILDARRASGSKNDDRRGMCGRWTSVAAVAGVCSREYGQCVDASRGVAAVLLRCVAGQGLGDGVEGLSELTNKFVNHCGGGSRLMAFATA